MSLANPLNTILVVPLVYVLYRIFFPPYPENQPQATTYEAGEYNWAPPKHPATQVFKVYKPHELAKFDGRADDKAKILLAIARLQNGKIKERTVFDVTGGRNFYGPEGMYGNFAGRDASRGMAKQSFDEEMLTPLDQPLDPLTDLTKSEIENMHGWHDHFSGKYTVCGVLEE